MSLHVHSLPNINLILATPAYNASSSRGASMGRRSYWGDQTLLHLQQVRFHDGDYDAGGAYWGGGRGSQALWCAFSDPEADVEEPTMVFLRADSRKAAKDAVRSRASWDSVEFHE